MSWEASPGLKEAVGDGEVKDMVHGASGWVAVGDCGRSFACPTAWFSRDGETWSQHRLPSTHFHDEIWQAAAGATGFLVYALEDDGQQQPHQPWPIWAQFWFSKDGENWNRHGRLPDVSDPFPWGLAFAPSGAIVIGRVWTSPERATGPYVSHDGHVWDLVSPRSLGVDAMSVELVASTGTEVFLVGSACEQVDVSKRACDPRVWTSTDGVAWDAEGAIHSNDGTPIGGARSIASDGERLVATGQRCNRTDYCDIWGQIWASAGDGQWSLRLDRQGFEDGHVVYTGSTFLYIGLDSSQGNPVMLASADGAAWTEIPDEGLPYDDEDCTPWVAAGDDVVVAGSWLCGWYERGMVQVDGATQ